MKIRLLVVLSALFTLLINRCISYNSLFIEQYYSNFLFRGIRFSYDYTFGLLPVASFYLLILSASILFIKYITKLKSSLSDTNKYQVTLWKLTRDLVILISIIITSFYWLWAFNYKRPSFEKRNNLEEQIIHEDWLFEELETVHQELNLTLQKPHNNFRSNIEMEKACRLSIVNILSKSGYLISGRVRVRQLRPDGLLLIWSTAGVYLPFVSEGHIDNGLPEITKPFTLAHEMSHGYGITGESDCNFTAFLACINSDDIRLRYSGWMGYFRYLLSACKRTNSERLARFNQTIMDEKIRLDLSNIHNELNKFPDIMPILRENIYNRYLKNHGISEGIISYGRVIHLAAAWKIKHGSYYLDE